MNPGIYTTKVAWQSSSPRGHCAKAVWSIQSRLLQSGLLHVYIRAYAFAISNPSTESFWTLNEIQTLYNGRDSFVFVYCYGSNPGTVRGMWCASDEHLLNEWKSCVSCSLAPPFSCLFTHLHALEPPSSLRIVPSSCSAQGFSLNSLSLFLSG